jgi:hypothetical protein
MGLTLEEANRILRGTLAKAQELNIKISAAICDPGGRPIALQRMDNTMWADHPRLDLAVHRIPRLQRDLLAHADLDHRCDVRMVAVVAAMPNPSPSSGESDANLSSCARPKGCSHLAQFPQGGCRMRRDRYQAWASVTARPVAITGDGINHFG